MARTVNTSDPNRIFHTSDKWECLKAGMYATSKDGIKRTDAEKQFADFLLSPGRLREAMEHVSGQWNFSCEHYFTNVGMNRLAWLEQAAFCYATGIPATMSRGGFDLVPSNGLDAANQLALACLNRWMTDRGREVVSLGDALSDNQVDLY